MVPSQKVYVLWSVWAAAGRGVATFSLFAFMLLPARRSGLYRFMIIMAAASNMVYGSTLSPPRLAQLREALSCHFANFTSDSDPLFLLWGHSIAAQSKRDASLPGAMDELYKALQTSELLASKGEKVICFPRAPNMFSSNSHWERRLSLKTCPSFASAHTFLFYFQSSLPVDGPPWLQRVGWRSQCASRAKAMSQPRQFESTSPKVSGPICVGVECRHLAVACAPWFG